MHLKALATDFDDTLAEHGRVNEATLQALIRLKQAGIALLMVTGRIIPELLTLLPPEPLFDGVIGENGGVFLRPGRPPLALAPPVPDALISACRSRNILPLSIGQVMLSTLAEYHSQVDHVINETRADCRIILNKASLMVLPTGTTKATGLRHAARELGIDPREIAAIGDAENDIDFLAASGLPLAVANALPSVKAKARWVASLPRGEGVAQAIDCWFPTPESSS